MFRFEYGKGVAAQHRQNWLLDERVKYQTVLFQFEQDRL